MAIFYVDGTFVNQEEAVLPAEYLAILSMEPWPLDIFLC